MIRSETDNNAGIDKSIYKAFINSSVMCLRNSGYEKCDTNNIFTDQMLRSMFHLLLCNTLGELKTKDNSIVMVKEYIHVCEKLIEETNGN